MATVSCSAWAFFFLVLTDLTMNKTKNDQISHCVLSKSITYFVLVIPLQVNLIVVLIQSHLLFFLICEVEKKLSGIFRYLH